MSIHERVRHFDTQGRFWTPDWDHARSQPKTVQAVRLPDDTWHEFRHFVSVAEANEVYQNAIRGNLGLAKAALGQGAAG